MSAQIATQPVESITLEAVVIRKDGTREDLGELAYWHRNPLIRAARRLKGKTAPGKIS